MRTRNHNRTTDGLSQTARASVWAGIAMVGLVVLSSSHRTAIAQTAIRACVTCTQPDRRYACEVLPPEDAAMVVSPQLFCAGEVARLRDHKSCTVVRSNTGNCQGEPVTLAYTGPVSELPASSDADVPAETISNSTAKPAKPPKTLVEATDRAVQSTGRQLKKAGEAISSTGQAVSDVTKKTGKTIKDTGSNIGETITDTAKASWNCLVSLFQSCE